MIFRFTTNHKSKNGVALPLGKGMILRFTTNLNSKNGVARKGSVNPAGTGYDF